MIYFLAQRCRRVLAALFLFTLLAIDARSEDVFSALREQAQAKEAAIANISVKFVSEIERWQEGKWRALRTSTQIARSRGMVYCDTLFTYPDPTELERQYSHLAMSYNLSETRILNSVDHGRVFPGDERVQFRPSEDFLGLQGYPTNDFCLFADKQKVTCNILDWADASEFTIAENTSDRLVLQGRHDRLVFDPNKDFSLLERRHFTDNQEEPILAYSLSDFAQYAGGMWLPRHVQIEAWSSGKPEWRCQTHLTEVSFDSIPEDLFVLKFPKLASIEDARYGRQKPDGKKGIIVYRIPTDQKDLEKVVSDSIQRSEARSVVHAKGLSVRTGLLYINIGALIVMGLIMGYVRWLK